MYKKFKYTGKLMPLNLRVPEEDWEVLTEESYRIRQASELSIRMTASELARQAIRKFVQEIKAANA